MSELTYLKGWEVESNSGHRPHIVKLRSDGRLSCDCRCWIYNIKKSGFIKIAKYIWSSRDCSHLHRIDHDELVKVFVSMSEKDREILKH